MEIRTSATHPIQVAWLDLPVAGRLGMTFAPGKQCDGFHTPGRWERDLKTDLDALRADGVTRLVSLVEAHELRAMKITRLVSLARRRAIEVTRFPIVDVDVPRDARAFRNLLVHIDMQMRVFGAHVVVHCAGGLGRTGVVTACALVHAGLMSNADALRAVAAARGPRCPETEAQRIFVERWSN